MRRFKPKVVLVVALVITIGAVAPALGKKGGRRRTKAPPVTPPTLETFADGGQGGVGVLNAEALGGGDTCALATPIAALPFSDTGNTCSFVDDYDEICPYTGSTSPDVAYSYTPASNIAIDISLCNSSYDTKVYVYEGGCPGTLIACNDDSCGGDGWKSELLSVSLTGGNTYYIIVDGYGGDCGDYIIDVTETSPPTSCPPGTLFGQEVVAPGDLYFAPLSDMSTGLLVYENFWDVEHPICDIHWWGLNLWYCERTPPDMFEIKFYVDNGGTPGAEVWSYIVTPQKTGTGIFYFGDQELYEYSADLEPCCELTSGWVSIQALADGGGCWFAWMDSATGDGSAYQGDGFSTWQLGQDLSVCLTRELPSCPPGTTLFGQEVAGPEDFSGPFSDVGSTYLAYENFWDIDEPISDIHWWGVNAWYCERTPPDMFEIKFYLDDAGSPGAEVCSYIVTPQKMGTGSLYADHELYEYSADLEPSCELTSGWVSIQALEDPGGCWFAWISSPTGDGLSYQWVEPDLVPLGNNLSLCLTGMDQRAGACCLGTRCVDVNEAECAEMGGWYSGSGTQCTTGSPMVYLDRPGMAIPDADPCGVSHTITVPDACTIADVNIDVMIEHTWIGDLVIEVEHLGKKVTLWDHNCDLGNRFEDVNVIFDDEGNPLVCASPTVGNIIPFEALSAFDGDNAAGDWTITIKDEWFFDTGALVGWSVHIEPTIGSPTVHWGVPSLPIPDDDEVGVSRTITVPDSFTLADVDIDVMIDHIWIGDLVIEIEHLGQTVTLWNHDCDWGNQFEDVNVIFDDEGNAVECSSPTVGNIIPAEGLWVFDGMDAAGDWTITIRDTWAFFSGSLVRWSLHLDKPAPAGNPTVYWGDPGLIPDADPWGVSHTITVPDACTIADVNIDVWINHTSIGDLWIEVEHLGVVVPLWIFDCWLFQDMDVVFDDEGALRTCNNPTVGNIWPAVPLSLFDGLPADGNWTITVVDLGDGNTGRLEGWSVHIEPTVGSPKFYLGDPGLPIPDDEGPGVSHTIDVPDSFTLGDVDVDVMIEHTWIGDLAIDVEHLGQTVTLWNRDCDLGNQFEDVNVIFDDEGNTVECASPTVGNIIPFETLSVFDGMDSAGEWTITVRDEWVDFAGTLVRWSLHLDGIGPCSEPPVQAEMKFTPQALNTCSSGGSAKAHFILPDMYDPCDIADWLPARLRLLDIEVLSEEIKVIAGKGGTELNKIMFTFDRAPFCTLETDEMYADVMVYGWLTSGQSFMGTDTIKIITNPQQFMSVLGSYWLSPDCGEADSCDEFDLNGDSIVNFTDFAIQQQCLAPAPEIENPK